MSKETIVEEFLQERIKQDRKWGEQNHPSVDPILTNRENGCSPERMCEQYEIPTENRAKFLCDNAANKNQCTWAHIIVEELSEVISAKDEILRREELVQLGACVLAWIESIDRNKN